MIKYPTCYSTVDIIPYSPKTEQILLCRKPNAKKYRCVGGFLNPREVRTSAAFRELGEEVSNIIVFDMSMVNDFVIDDIRYRGTEDSITTTLFIARTDFSRFDKMKAQDDIEEIKLFNVNDKNLLENIVDEHKEIVKVGVEEILRKTTNE